MFGCRVRVISQLDDATLARYLPQWAPAWARFGDYDRVEFLNTAVAALWLPVNSQLLGWCAAMIEAALRHSAPSSLVRDARVVAFDCGPEPPRITGVKGELKKEGGREYVDIDVEVVWDGAPDVTLRISPNALCTVVAAPGLHVGGIVPSIYLHLRRAQFSGRLRFRVGRLLPGVPFANAVQLSVMDVPYIALSLSAGSSLSQLVHFDVLSAILSQELTKALVGACGWPDAIPILDLQRFAPAQHPRRQPHAEGRVQATESRQHGPEEAPAQEGGVEEEGRFWCGERQPQPIAVLQVRILRASLPKQLTVRADTLTFGDAARLFVVLATQQGEQRGALLPQVYASCISSHPTSPTFEETALLVLYRDCEPQVLHVAAADHRYPHDPEYGYLYDSVLAAGQLPLDAQLLAAQQRAATDTAVPVRARPGTPAEERSEPGVSAGVAATPAAGRGTVASGDASPAGPGASWVLVDERQDGDGGDGAVVAGAGGAARRPGAACPRGNGGDQAEVVALVLAPRHGVLSDAVPGVLDLQFDTSRPPARGAGARAASGKESDGAPDAASPFSDSRPGVTGAGEDAAAAGTPQRRGPGADNRANLARALSNKAGFEDTDVAQRSLSQSIGLMTAQATPEAPASPPSPHPGSHGADDVGSKPGGHTTWFWRALLGDGSGSLGSHSGTAPAQEQGNAYDGDAATLRELFRARSLQLDGGLSLPLPTLPPAHQEDGGSAAAAADAPQPGSVELQVAVRPLLPWCSRLRPATDGAPRPHSAGGACGLGVLQVFVGDAWLGVGYEDSAPRLLARCNGQQLKVVGGAVSTQERGGVSLEFGRHMAFALECPPQQQRTEIGTSTRTSPGSPSSPSPHVAVGPGPPAGTLSSGNSSQGSGAASQGHAGDASQGSAGAAVGRPDSAERKDVGGGDGDDQACLRSPGAADEAPYLELEVVQFKDKWHISLLKLWDDSWAHADAVAVARLPVAAVAAAACSCWNGTLTLEVPHREGPTSWYRSGAYRTAPQSQSGQGACAGWVQVRCRWLPASPSVSASRVGR